MKVKKAIKRLDRVDELLSSVIDQYEVSEPGARELLDSAKKSVVRAKAALKKQASSEPRKDAPAHVSRKARQIDAEVQSDGMKRKGASAEAALAVSKSA
jgi:hypothetical protein